MIEKKKKRQLSFWGGKNMKNRMGGQSEKKTNVATFAILT